MRSIGLRFGCFVVLFCRLSLSVCCTFVQSCVVKFVLFRHGFVRGVVHIRYYELVY